MSNYRDNRHIEIRSTVNTREVHIERTKNSRDIFRGSIYTIFVKNLKLWKS